MTLLEKIERPLFIVNSEANDRKSLNKWSQIRYYLKTSGIAYSAGFMKNREETIDLVRNDRLHNKIIAVGGDGTVNAVVEGMMESNLERILGIIPAGTGNDLARAFKIYSNLEELSYILSSFNIREIDVWKVNDRYFLGFASLGFDAEVLRERNRRYFLRGKLAYISAAVRAFLNYKSKQMKIKIDEKEIDKNVFLIVVSNIKHYAGGMKIAPFAEPDDSLLDLCLIEGESNIDLILRNLSVYSGNHVNNPEVYYYQGKQLEIFTKEPVLLQIDGEIIAENGYFKFELVNKKIKILVHNLNL